MEPGTQKYEIDWNASALIAGAVPAQFTVEEDHRTYDLRGQAGPLMEILQILRANGIPMGGNIDIRSNPVVRQQVTAVVRRAVVPRPLPPPRRSPAPAAFMPQMPTVTTSQRLQELETLRATGTISEAEYNAKRQQILSELWRPTAVPALSVGTPFVPATSDSGGQSLDGGQTRRRGDVRMTAGCRAV